MQTNLEFLTFQPQKPRPRKYSETYGFLCWLWDHVLCGFFLHPLPSLGLNYHTSKLGGERKLLTSSVSLEFSKLYLRYTSQKPLFENFTSVSPGSQEGPSISYLVGEGIFLVLLGG